MADARPFHWEYHPEPVAREVFRIEGGRPLNGTVPISGAKNAALKLFAAATLTGERCEIYPFLGSYLLAEAIDAAGADLVLHGHAHGGTEAGTTAGGVPVRNVAQPVLRSPYKVFTLNR